MPLPGDLTTCVLTGTFTDTSGNPMRGTVTITPNAALADATGNVIIPQVPRVYQLFSGSFTSAPLVATDNTDISPQGFAYAVTVALQGVPTYSLTVLLPHSASPVDLSALSPAASVPELAGALPVTGGVLTGKLTLNGSTPLQIPAGAAAGDVLTSDASGNGSWQPLSAELPAATSGTQGAIELSTDLGGTATAPHVVGTHLASALPIAQGGTAATSSSAALTALGAASSTALTAETARAEAAEAAAQAAAIAASLPALTANVSVSASGTLALNTVTEASASGSALTMTLPSSTAGDVIVCEKSDSSANTVSITGNIRGVSSTTQTLKLQNESTMFLGYAGSWWPVAGHKTLGSLDGRYGEKPAATENVSYVSASSAASDSNDGLSWGSAKASIAGALTALGSSAGTIMMGPGTFTLSAADGNGNGVTLPYQGTVLQGSGQQVTTISVTGSVTWGILCQGQFSAVKDVHLQVASGGSVTYGIGVDTVSSTGSAESCLFESCLSSVSAGGTLTNGFGVGPTHTGSAAVDIAETMFRRCRSSGAANAGYLVGNGTSGNILNTHMHQCSAVSGVYGVYAQNTGYTWLQGDVGENTTADFYQNSLSVSNPVAIQGLRSENSARLLQSSTQGNSLDLTLRDINWEPGTHMSSAGDWINYGMGGTLVLDNVKCTGGSYTPVILLNTTGHLAVTASALATAAPLGQAFSVSSTQTIGVTAIGYTQLSSSGGDPPVSVTSAAVRLGWTSPTVSINSTSRNVAAPVEVQTLNSSGAVTINGGAEFAEITLKANATSSSITNLMQGQRYTISWIQDSTGSRTYVWPTACVFAGGVTPSASTAAGDVDTCTFYYDGTSLIAVAPNWQNLAGVSFDTTSSHVKSPASGAASIGTSGYAPESDHIHPLNDPLALGFDATFAWNTGVSTGAFNTASNGFFIRLMAGGYSMSNAVVYVASASGNISMAAYTTGGSGTSTRPSGGQLATTGAVACPAAGQATVALGGSCTPNLADWLAISCDNTTATFQKVTQTISTGWLGMPVAAYATSAHPLPSSPSAALISNYTYMLRGA